MARWLKWIGIALLALVLLLSAAVATALVLVDTKALRGAIEQRVEAATGRELRIEGALEISVFPWLGFELGRTRLANAAGFGEEPFAALDRAELRVRVLPLLTGEVALDRVVLHGPAIDLQRNAQGRTNWDDLVAAGPTGEDSQPSAGEPSGDSGLPIELSIEGVELRDATLSWRDAGTGQVLRLTDLDLTTGALAPATATPVELGLTLEGKDIPRLIFSATADMRFTLEGPRVELSGLDSDVEAQGEAVPGGEARAGLQGDVALDLGAGTARVDGLVLTALDTLRANGALQISFGESGTGVSGELALEPFDPRALAEAMAIEWPRLADEQAASEASARLEFNGGTSALEIGRLEARLDATRLTGSAELGLGDIPDLRAQLAVDEIDIDRYLPAGSAAAADDEGAGGSAADPVESLPLEALRGVRADIEATIERLGYNGLDMTDVRVEADLEKGVLRLRRAGLATAGGRLGLSGKLDARSDSPAASIATEVSGVAAEPVLEAFAGNAPIVGSLDSSVRLETVGPTLDAWTRALAGRFEAAFADGAIRGINIARSLRRARARLTGGDLDAATAERRTDFSVMRVRGRVEEGVIRSDELDLRSPLLRVSGAGQADIPQQTLDYTARILVTSTLTGQGGAGMRELKGLEIPVRLSGSWLDPGIDLQLGEAFTGRAEQQLEAEKEAKKKELKQKRDEAKEKLERKKKEAGDKLRDQLEGAFD